MDDERDLSLDAESVGNTSGDGEEREDLSALDTCRAVFKEAERKGINTMPGPDEDAIRDIGKLKGGARDVRIRRERQ